jgi:hypothetical protein
MATNSGRGNQSKSLLYTPPQLYPAVILVYLEWTVAHHDLHTVGASEGPSKVGEGAPPPLSKDVKESVSAGQADGAGVHAAGQDAAMAPADTKVKSAKECMSQEPKTWRKHKQRAEQFPQ